jgi:hypothetical protein
MGRLRDLLSLASQMTLLKAITTGLGMRKKHQMMFRSFGSVSAVSLAVAAASVLF